MALLASPARHHRARLRFPPQPEAHIHQGPSLRVRIGLLFTPHRRRLTTLNDPPGGPFVERSLPSRFSFFFRGPVFYTRTPPPLAHPSSGHAHTSIHVINRGRVVPERKAGPLKIKGRKKKSPKRDPRETVVMEPTLLRFPHPFSHLLTVRPPRKLSAATILLGRTGYATSCCGGKRGGGASISELFAFSAEMKKSGALTTLAACGGKKRKSRDAPDLRSMRFSTSM